MGDVDRELTQLSKLFQLSHYHDLKENPLYYHLHMICMVFFIALRAKSSKDIGSRPTNVHDSQQDLLSAC